jgi:hypothetical protein
LLKKCSVKASYVNKNPTYFGPYSRTIFRGRPSLLLHLPPFSCPLRHLSLLVCGRMPSICMCVRCTCLCAVWSCFGWWFIWIVLYMIVNYSIHLWLIYQGRCITIRKERFLGCFACWPNWECVSVTLLPLDRNRSCHDRLCLICCKQGGQIPRSE